VSAARTARAAPEATAPARAGSAAAPSTRGPRPLRILIPVTGAYHGRLRVRRSTGGLDTEGLDRVLSAPSAQAIALAKQLRPEAELVAAHVDKGNGEEVLREALAHGLDHGILVEGAEEYESDPSTRAATIADVYRQSGPFDAVIGPARSEFAGFTGTLAAVAGVLELPIVVGVKGIKADGSTFQVAYESIFGDYDLRIPRPCVVLPGDVPQSYPTAWDIHDAYRVRGILRVRADQLALEKARTKRMRIVATKAEVRAVETVDGATLVRRMRSRALIPEAAAE
jgi:electron transfer flavoprotein alpha/beta subunit